uniref:hypothetical protein n=1 Tax=Parabacteroides sp. 20_3 TaxID=469591 RepID=UPI00356B56B9
NLVGFCACYFSNLVGFCSFILVIWSAFILFSNFYRVVYQIITIEKRLSYKNSPKTFSIRKGILGKLKGKAYKLLKPILSEKQREKREKS